MARVYLTHWGANKSSWLIIWTAADGKERQKSCGPGEKGKKLAEQLRLEIEANRAEDIYPEYPGYTDLREAARNRSWRHSYLVRVLRKLGLEPENKEGKDWRGQTVYKPFVSDLALQQVDKHRNDPRLADEITVWEAAKILWPEEDKELRKLERAASQPGAMAEAKGRYKKARSGLKGRVHHLIRTGN